MDSDEEVPAAASPKFHLHAYFYWIDGVGLSSASTRDVEFMGIKPRVDVCTETWATAIPPCCLSWLAVRLCEEDRNALFCEQLRFLAGLLATSCMVAVLVELAQADSRGIHGLVRAVPVRPFHQEARGG